MKKLALTDDECMNCLACELACAKAFYKSDDTRLSCVQIREKKGDSRPAVCIQCGKCEKACEAGAISLNDKGFYKIDKKLCTKCGSCVEACPLHVMVWPDKEEAPTKCIVCGICVKACPTGVLAIKES